MQIGSAALTLFVPISVSLCVFRCSRPAALLSLFWFFFNSRQHYCLFLCGSCKQHLHWAALHPHLSFNNFPQWKSSIPFLLNTWECSFVSCAEVRCLSALPQCVLCHLPPGQHARSWETFIVKASQLPVRLFPVLGSVSDCCDAGMLQVYMRRA